MARSHCFPAFSAFFSRKKSKESPNAVKKASCNGDLRVNPEELVEQSGHNAAEEASAKEVVLPMIQEKISAENELQAPQVASVGGEDHDSILSMDRDFSAKEAVLPMIQEKISANNELQAPEVAHECGDDILSMERDFSGKEVVLPMVQEKISAENELQAPEVTYDGTDEHYDILPVERDFSAKEAVLPIIQEKFSVENDLQAPEVAYEGGDEHDDILSMKRDFSGFDLQAIAVQKNEVDSAGGLHQELNIDGLENKLAVAEGITPEARIQNGHVSDPGISRTSMLQESPILKRSCSNIETRRATKLIWYTTQSNSSDDLPSKWEALDVDAAYDVPGSPLSVLSSFSADRAKSKKRSPCLVLPSRSTEFWRNRVILSHRKHNTPWILIPQAFPVDDKFKNNGANGLEKLESRPCFDKKNEPTLEQSEIDSKEMWVAFSAEYSTRDRVHAWVDSLEDGLFCTIENNDSAVVASYEVGETSRKRQTRTGRSTANEIMQAKGKILQPAFSFPPAAHTACRGSKVMPPISAFGNLRTLNLSGNSIDDVSLRFLPKNLHTLNLSKNKIATLEGLREMTKLRILNLSDNRISRIGHGVSNCILMKELYLAGNKIGNVEGLHRLLKLTVLDLSSNRINTLLSLGQLVANHKSLLVLDLQSNPIGNNMGDEPLRKSICSFLPGLVYLNKRPIKSQGGREVAICNSITKAALSGNACTSRPSAGATRRGAGGGAARRNNRRPSKYSRASRK